VLTFHDDFADSLSAADTCQQMMVMSCREEMADKTTTEQNLAQQLARSNAQLDHAAAELATVRSQLLQAQQELAKIKLQSQQASSASPPKLIRRDL